MGQVVATIGSWHHGPCLVGDCVVVVDNSVVAKAQLHHGIWLVGHQSAGWLGSQLRYFRRANIGIDLQLTLLSIDAPQDHGTPLRQTIGGNTDQHRCTDR